MGVPKNGGFIMEHPMKIDDLRVPLFQETTIYKFLTPWFVKQWGLPHLAFNQ